MLFGARWSVLLLDQILLLWWMLSRLRYRKRALVSSHIAVLASARLHADATSQRPVRDVLSTRGLLRLTESIRVLRWANIPNPNYRAKQVVRLSREGLR